MEAHTVDYLYAKSFRDVPNGTHYAGYRGIAGRMESKSLRDSYLLEHAETEMKALNSQSGGAGTAGYALVPVYVDPVIIDESRKETPLVEIMPKVTNRGITADYNRLTAKGDATWGSEDAALVEADDTEDRASQDVKFLRVKGRVTGVAMASIPGYSLAGFQPSGQTSAQTFSDAAASNPMQYEVLKKTRALLEELEDTIINGDADTDANEFNGFIDQIGTTNKVDLNSTALSLDDITNAIRLALDDGGRPNLAVCSTAVYEDLQNLLNAKLGFMNPTREFFWGFETLVLNTAAGQLPVVWSRFMSNVSGSKAIYFLDLRTIELRVLQDVTYEELAKTSDSQPFFLKWYGCLVVKAPSFNAWVGEIA